MKEFAENYFYQLSPQQAVDRLQSDSEKGLSNEEAARRWMEHGSNQLRESHRRPMILRFLDQFKDLLIVVLILAALLAYILQDFRGGTILLVIVFMNALIGFYQEFKAEKILDSLKKIIAEKAIVIRSGQQLEIDQKQLVPGDLVYLEEGSAIPADLRLIRSSHFATNDFILTGESVPQPKSPELIFDRRVTLTDQDNLAFMGTTVAKGNAYGVVYGTGMQTAIGRIATASQSIVDDLSPLQQEINTLAKTLTRVAAFIALGIFGVNLILSLSGGTPFSGAVHLSLLLAISVAASCVPQGLPAQISVALSLGVGRLAKKQAIVKKLSAVETLGSTTVICSDKTGTLTQNQMTITHAFVMGRVFSITGQGYDPQGQIVEDNKPLSLAEIDSLKAFFEDGFLASNGRAIAPDASHDHWYAVGDPTEAAFTPLAIKAGLNPADLQKRFPLLYELPFDSQRKRMSMIREHKGKTIAYMKGSTESVLMVCNQVRQGDQCVDLNDGLRQDILSQAERWAGQALRVMALAYRDLSTAPQKEPSVDELEQNFIFAGLVAMIDPPRLAVPQAVEAAYRGGMRLMMITGDNAATALAIAERIGMGSALQAYTGDEIKAFSDDSLKEILKQRAVIFSRVSPQDKLRLVTLLKQMGEVVAVTGDGVNDTLSLKRADIGVAMGITGSEVAKEASEMVLLDDDFGTLVLAISEGRNIFQNLKKTILSTITSNNGELFCVLFGFGGMALGLPAPITAVQILAVDLIGEMLPLTALTFDPPEKGLMDQPPRNRQAHIIHWRSFLSLLFYGFWMGAAAFFSFFMLQQAGASLESARAGAYASIILCQFLNILSRRSEKTLFSTYLFTNPRLWISFLISMGFVAILIYVPFISAWFGFGPLTLENWVYPLVGGVVFLALHEGRKGVFADTNESS